MKTVRRGRPTTSSITLLLIALRNGHDYGGAMAAAIREATNDEVKMTAGTLYGCLGRMQRQKLITPLDPPRRAADSRDRRRYAITTAGIAAISRAIQRHRQILAWHDACLQRAPEKST